jgi:hypothetical protein
MKNFKNIKNIICLLLIATGFVSCDYDNKLDEIVEPEVILPAATPGSADFSNYVSIGPSFTAGITDNGLFIAAQENSFPNILSKKFANAGGGDFIQPMTSDNFGGLALNGNRISGPRLVFGGAGPVPLEAVIGPVTVTTDIVLNNPTGPFNNLGVPGAQSADFITPGFGNIANLGAGANAYAVRMTGGTPDVTILELAVAQNPTFFTADLIGGNDVLGYATQGGDASRSTITPPAEFAVTFNTIIDGLTANGAKGAVTNTPYVNNLPYFTAVSYNPVPLDAATAAQLNAGYAAYNGGLQAAFQALAGTGLFTQEELDRRTINFTEGNNALVMVDEYLTDLGAINPAFAGLPQFRQTTETDLITLPTASLLPSGAGTATPLLDLNVLTFEEQQEIKVAVDAYNSTIQSVAAAKGLAYVDVNQILIDAATTGIAFDEYFLNADLVFGGLVSLDGIHLTARGYAYMANLFLKAIDDTYGSNFGESGNFAKAGNYPTNYSPSLQTP